MSKLDIILDGIAYAGVSRASTVLEATVIRRYGALTFEVGARYFDQETPKYDEFADYFAISSDEVRAHVEHFGEVVRSLQRRRQICRI